MTAVEFLEKICNNRGYHLMEEYFEQAKQMEKKQIIDANRDGVDMVIMKGKFITGEDYYMEKYDKS